MTYDTWKTTNPDDRFLGPMGIVEAWELYHDGEISLTEMGNALLDNGYSHKEVRHLLSEESKHPIPVGYFGKE